MSITEIEKHVARPALKLEPDPLSSIYIIRPHLGFVELQGDHQILSSGASF